MELKKLEVPTTSITEVKNLRWMYLIKREKREQQYMYSIVKSGGGHADTRAI